VSFILDEYPKLMRDCANFAAAIGSGAWVLVGGQARSGKSTFASALKDALKSAGKRAVVLGVDRWLRDAPARLAGVLGRYDLQGLQALVDGLSAAPRHATEVQLAGYHKLKRETMEAVEKVLISPTDVVIVEGTVALALQLPESTEVHRFHVEIAESERRERVLREYRLRGADASEGATLYEARLRDEYPVIQGLARGACRVAAPSQKEAVAVRLDTEVR
jgi:uridine kinase